MKVMGLWKDDLCPCCRMIPEKSPTHLFHCPETSIVSLCNSSFHDILHWLDSVQTCPVILDIITAFWKNLPLALDPTDSIKYRQIYNNLQEIGVQSMWQGLLPNGLIELQHEHYQIMGHKRTGTWWGTQLVGKMLQATHLLWLHRNQLLHLKTENGSAGLDMIQLQEAVQQQLLKGREGMDEKDWSLLDTHIDDIMADSTDYI